MLIEDGRIVIDILYSHQHTDVQLEQNNYEKLVNSLCDIVFYSILMKIIKIISCIICYITKQLHRQKPVHWRGRGWDLGASITKRTRTLSLQYNTIIRSINASWVVLLVLRTHSQSKKKEKRLGFIYSATNYQWQQLLSIVTWELCP